MKNFLFKTITSLMIFFFINSLFSSSYADDYIENEQTIDVNAEVLETNSSNFSTIEPSSINSRACIVFDRNSKMILYGKNERKQVKMASTTKIMTAIIVIENCNLNDTVEVSKKAASTDGSRLGLKSGDKITIKDLLYGLMLVSGNDAAVALAEHVGGDIQGFADLMNNKANELGLTNTHYESPHGLDSDGHYTTAYELAKLADYALKNETFSNIVGTKNYTVTINGYPKNLSNTNELLGNLNGIYGVKTGFTNGANRCLVTSCKRGDMDIICVVLGADTKNYRTKDSIKLIEYAFNNFTYINANKIATKYFESWMANNLENISINKASCKSPELSLQTLENPIISINKEAYDNISTDISINTNLEAPIPSNSILGTLSINLEGTNLVTLDITSSTDINRKNIFYYLNYFFTNYTNILENVLY